MNTPPTVVDTVVIGAIVIELGSVLEETFGLLNVPLDLRVPSPATVFPPLANLWHGDDAVKDYGDGGTQACAYTGREAARQAEAHLDRARVAAAA